MANVPIESKRLALQLAENEEKYIIGELDLTEPLQKTDELFQQLFVSGSEPATASKILYDSNLMKMQTRIARQKAKYYKPDTMAFNASEFSMKLAHYYGQPSTNQKGGGSSVKGDDLMWMKIGDVARKLLYTVPSFNYIYGTFDPDPVEVVKKKRKMREKDKIGDLTRPHSMSLNESSENQDIVIKEAERAYIYFMKLCKKSETNMVCYFEFVTDPTSFSRTVENIFIVSILVKEGCIRIIKDKKGSPYLALVDKERRERNSSDVKQCIISITKEDWQEIVRTFNFKKPLFPPRKTAPQCDSTT